MADPVDAEKTTAHLTEDSSGVNIREPLLPTCQLKQQSDSEESCILGGHLSVLGGEDEDNTAQAHVSADKDPISMAVAGIAAPQVRVWDLPPLPTAATTPTEAPGRQTCSNSSNSKHHGLRHSCQQQALPLLPPSRFTAGRPPLPPSWSRGGAAARRQSYPSEPPPPPGRSATSNEPHQPKYDYERCESGSVGRAKQQFLSGSGVRSGGSFETCRRISVRTVSV